MNPFDPLSFHTPAGIAADHAREAAAREYDAVADELAADGRDDRLLRSTAERIRAGEPHRRVRELSRGEGQGV